ncbi:fumarylacetoacetate hydrolase family protein [Kibdelosporangium philippinense]|uniref:Fumarylacetoacetate hydrolase family protein n=1 Tax=Kibdelosporangium philippinense TaxID=211113 RepID=A0ABS8ZC49_9PSEU|nr:fumarylacetoacetate hydrolase family protein [Kibdelosporangium philippinense]MCE7004256.1 fumarylacetoacetate hydrolase family protein [Kibdelosporangium philippinense]
MKLATLRMDDGLHVARVHGDGYVDLGKGDVGELLADPDWRSRAAAGGTYVERRPGDLAPVIPRPGKIVCVGLNYRTHIAEMKREVPRHPALFAKFPEVLIGPYDVLTLPPESAAVDWEAELVVVIGQRVRRADKASAQAAIAGYTIMNDVSMRDWQFRTSEWLQGKTWEATTPLGPYLVTPDELAPDATIQCTVDEERMQHSTVDDLLFGPVDLVEYISAMVTLNPGDLIATGTTGGVGHARTPPRYLRDGQTLVTEIYGIGAMANQVRCETT